MADPLSGPFGEDRLLGLRSWMPPGQLLDAIAQNEGASRSTEEVIAAIGKSAELWDLHILQPYNNVTQNFVAPVFSAAHGPAVIKVAFNAFMFERECLALRLFDGRGAVKVLEWDSSLCSMLLEKADPGLPMVLDWDEQTDAFCSLLNSLWKPASAACGLPTVEFEARSRLQDLSRMLSLFGERNYADRHETVMRAVHVLEKLTLSNYEQFLIHGDLHAENMLSSHRLPWLSIDPIGCVGERAFDACTLFREETAALRNASNPRELTERRLRTLSRDCGLDEDRLRAWSFVEAVRIQGWHYSIGMSTDEWNLLIPVLQPE